jgi:hypothetical protein
MWYLRQPPNHDAVVALLPYSLCAVTLEDDEDMSPLDHAIISDASWKTLKMLQSAQGMMLLTAGLQSFIRTAIALKPNGDSSRSIKKIRRVSERD